MNKLRGGGFRHLRTSIHLQSPFWDHGVAGAYITATVCETISTESKFQQEMSKIIILMLSIVCKRWRDSSAASRLPKEIPWQNIRSLQAWLIDRRDTRTQRTHPGLTVKDQPKIDFFSTTKIKSESHSWTKRPQRLISQKHLDYPQIFSLRFCGILRQKNFLENMHPLTSYNRRETPIDPIVAV